MEQEIETSLEGLKADAFRRYVERFGGPPRWGAAAPGRVNLIGEHTDYNGGCVLPIAIERYCVVAAGPARTGISRFASVSRDEERRADLSSPVQPRDADWVNYILGVACQFQRRGAAPPNMDALIVSSVPVGSGLSSSAALCVATATFIEQATGVAVGERAKAEMCQRVEHEFVGVPCGIMDQTASIMGRSDQALYLDCRSGSIEYVTMPGRDRAVLLVVDTSVHHDLATNEYGVRRAQCEAALESLRSLTGRSLEALRDVDLAMLEQHAPQMEQVEYRRARHVVTENERVAHAVEALRNADLAAFGSLMYASHESLRCDYEVSCAELDCVVAAAQTMGSARGVFGARMTGGGFGGCAIVLCEPASAARTARRLADVFEAEFGRSPSVFPTSAAGGACALRWSQ